jgi:5-dehydro-4-deoxyglucarate dehydratase
MEPKTLRGALRSGLPTFPITPFDAEFGLDLGAYEDHIGWLASFGPSIFFAAGVNGEFFSLGLDEVTAVVRAAKSAAGSIPVVAGCGYGTSIAIGMARAAEAAGADGILLLPPYLVAASQEGLARHVKAVCDAVGIGVVVYNRDNCVLTAETLTKLFDDCENLIAVKDGHGDLKLAREIIGALGDRAAYICGMPTAEISASAFREIGADNYSSGVFNFAPRMALAFHKAVHSGDAAQVNALTASFFDAFIVLRDRRKGNLIPMVKGGVRAVGRNPGPVRPPLVDLTPADQNALADLIKRVEIQVQEGVGQ